RTGNLGVSSFLVVLLLALYSSGCAEQLAGVREQPSPVAATVSASTALPPADAEVKIIVRAAHHTAGQDARTELAPPPKQKLTLPMAISCASTTTSVCRRGRPQCAWPRRT